MLPNMVYLPRDSRRQRARLRSGPQRTDALIVFVQAPPVHINVFRIRCSTSSSQMHRPQPLNGRTDRTGGKDHGDLGHVLIPARRSEFTISPRSYWQGAAHADPSVSATSSACPIWRPTSPNRRFRQSASPVLLRLMHRLSAPTAGHTPCYRLPRNCSSMNLCGLRRRPAALFDPVRPSD